MKSIIRAMLVIMFISCGDSDYYLKKYQEIWDCSNTNLQLAVDMFDTVHVYAEQQSEHLSHKYQLLQIRLDDKADIIPTSDAMILSLLKYFEDKGSRREKQEAYYYAGSVYRDLKDTPHSLTYFLRSVDIAQEGCCDSLLLRNAYSNLHWLYYSVQDFSMALEMALKEYDIACRINTVGTNVLIHIGATLHKMGRDDEAVEYLDQALQIVLSNEQCLSEYDLITLLFNYTYTGQCDKASLCYNAITCNIDSGKPQGTRLCMALAGYHELRGDVDSAIHYYRQALETMPDLSYTYDAARQLFRLYDQKHDMEKAYQYARLYLSTGDSLDLGGRQQIAATTNNMYQYHRNSERERVLDEEREQASLWATRTAVTCIIVVVSLIAFYLYKRKLHNDTQKDQQGRIAMLEQKINDVEMLQYKMI